jgi:hypothetical protein
VSAEIWTYRNRSSGREENTPLTLDWEVEGDPISDNYTPDEISAEDLLAEWVRTRTKTDEGWARISWYILPAWENAPFGPWKEHFLTYFSWPVNARGEHLQWMRLPVEDKLWHPGGKGRTGRTVRERSDKGGFIQEATGWKPSPLQDLVHVGTLLVAARFRPAGEQWR